FFFSSRRRHTRSTRDWSSDVCSSDLTTGLVVVHSALILTAFLVMLNGCLRGSAKAGIDAVLSVVWLGLLGAVLIIFGWQSAVLGLALSFVYAAGTRPIARSLARRMLGYR